MVVVGVLAALLASAGCSSTSAPTTPRQATPLPQVRDISVVITQSGVEVHASVVLASCTTVGNITQSRSGNTIEVTVPEVDSEMAAGQLRVCLSLGPGSMATSAVRLMLQGPFPAGDYVVRVNGVAQAFHVDE
jgi:hypothetical protein